VFADEDFDRAGGLAPDDIVGQYFLQMWPQAALERSTTGYDQVLNAEPAMLRKMFADKVVVVGDFCTVGKDKLYQAPDGRELAGIYAQAMGIESLINGRTIRQPGMISLGGWRLYGQRPVDVAGAVAGVLLGAWLWRRAVRRGFVLCVLLLFAVGLSVLVYRWQRTIYLPFVPCLAMLLATELSAAIERARGGARRLSVNMSSVHRPQLA
jgi:CHASE2 domain-containing sensor protein